MPNDAAGAPCPRCGAPVGAEGVVARGGRWHPECLTRATLEKAMGVDDETAQAPVRSAPHLWPPDLLAATHREPATAGAARALMALLGMVSLAVFLGAAYIIVDVGGGPGELSTRFYIALGATAILFAIDAQYGRLVRRLAPAGLGESRVERRYRVRSALLLLAAAAALAALAFRPDIVAGPGVRPPAVETEGADASGAATNIDLHLPLAARYCA